MQFLCLCFAAFFLVFLSSCCCLSENPDCCCRTGDKNHTHIVYFTLKEDSPETRKDLVDGCYEYLKGHPGVVHFSAGEIAEDMDRDVNDRNFHVGLHVVFASTEDHNKYQTAPKHLEFVDKFKNLWADVRVFDSLVKR